jgi:fluoroacetyl-CoA thioesterase
MSTTPLMTCESPDRDKRGKLRMKRELEVGMKHTKRVKVEKARTIGFMGDALRVYSTPSMVLDLEQTCNQFLQDHLSADKSSVGAHVSVDHLGPTLLDMWVDISITVTSIEGRRVSFEVEVRDELDLVGKAKHVRFVVDLAKQKERLEAKAAKFKQMQK